MNIFRNAGFMGQVPVRLGQLLPSAYRQSNMIPPPEVQEGELIQVMAPPTPSQQAREPFVDTGRITTPDYQPGDVIEVIRPYRPPYQLPPRGKKLTDEEFEELKEAISSNRRLLSPEVAPATPSAAYIGPPPAPLPLPPPIETLPMVPSVHRYGSGITPQNVVKESSLPRYDDRGVVEPPLPPPRYDYAPVPTGPRYTETPQRPITEYSPELQEQIQSYEQSRAEFESRPPIASQYEGRMTPQEVETEAARRHEEWAKGAGISTEETASVDCGPGMFWDPGQKKCRGSRPEGDMSKWASAALQFGPSGAQTATPGTQSGGYGGYTPPPPMTPSGPILGPSVMTGRVLGRRFPVINL